MSKIEWTDKTINFVWGCFNKCSYCYAKGIAKRFAEPIAKKESLTCAEGMTRDPAGLHKKDIHIDYHGKIQLCNFGKPPIATMRKVGKKHSGCLLYEKKHHNFPT